MRSKEPLSHTVVECFNIRTPHIMYDDVIIGDPFVEELKHTTSVGQWLFTAHSHRTGGAQDDARIIQLKPTRHVHAQELYRPSEFCPALSTRTDL